MVKFQGGLALALISAVVLFSLLPAGHGSAAAGNLTTGIDRRLHSSKKKCNKYQGRWVYDNKSPLYYQQNCPFLDKGFNCLKYGRPDHNYLHYVWTPDGCNTLPRFNAHSFLKRWRKKKIMFVGDSLGLNQWESLCCMIYGGAPKLKYKMDRQGTLSTLWIPKYGISIQYFRSTYIVDIVDGVLRLDIIHGGKSWKRKDMLVFNSYHWWTHTGQSQPFQSIRYGRKLYTNRMKAFNMALNTWARWIHKNINPAKTKVFFQGVSLPHYHCEGKTSPYLRPTSRKTRLPAAIVKRLLRRMKGTARLLDITPLSELRIDAHPERYGGNPFNDDCSHWCLPGLPDTWNQLLFS